MEIGVLLCGDVALSLRAEFGSYADCLKKRLNLYSYGEVTVWDVYQKNQVPENIDACDVYIIGGSPASVNDNTEWITVLIKFIQRAFTHGKKMVGICFGHQAIHHALGGVVNRSNKGWGIGAYQVPFLQNFENKKKGDLLSLLAIHQDQVIKPVKGFKVIAGNTFCPNYFTLFEQQVLTIQGHPEFSFSFLESMLALRQDILSASNGNIFSQPGNSVVDSDYCNEVIQQFIVENRTNINE